MAQLGETVMTKEEAKNLVVGVIEEKQGLKSIHILNALDANQLIAVVEHFNLSDILEELVTEGRIVEIEYILPKLDYRVKSFCLPKGTKISLRGTNDPTG